MKAIVCICFFAIVATALALPHDEQHYTTKYDNLNIDEMLGNERLVKVYIKCMLLHKDVKCPPEAIELQSHIKDALETDCSKCSEIQKEQTKKVIKFLIKNHFGKWEELVALYDPDHKYSDAHKDEIEDAKKN